jgi:CDGSH-type Zn-finger protein
MDKPVIAGKLPLVTTLEPGEYWWCACGLSKDQPYCDGSHKGTSFTPVKFDIEKSKKVALCLCKHTEKPPFCDGTHTKLKDE